MMKREWLKKSSIAVLLSTSLLMGMPLPQADAADVVSVAYNMMGKPYVSNGNTPEGFDSAGYVSYVMKQMGVTVADNLTAIKSAGTSVLRVNLQPGDIVILKSSTSTYAGVYVGNDKFLYASQGKGQVVEQTISNVAISFADGRRVLGTSTTAPTTTPTPAPAPAPASTDIAEKVIQAGLKYLGTPYEYASTRSTKTTMDCSEFTMWAYKEGAGIDMGRGGATSQSKYVKANGVYFHDVNQLKRGDLIFFMKYRGYKASDYTGIDAATQSITHIGIYMGDNKVLHTYSKESGGVKITDFQGTSWGYRFIAGGRPYK
ncbi:C40 family peptidase [Brevibacillus dissolubilis]|uniref:C40 family peptidase n=1 Tax=Brevibacillus dissolubilis TaxID=1844116 RepID=UPI00111696A9|nr:NlpC/P60 family protein [Brevibacillus dissolubilis]